MRLFHAVVFVGFVTSMANKGDKFKTKISTPMPVVTSIVKTLSILFTHQLANHKVESAIKK